MARSTQPQENALCVRANSVINILRSQNWGKPVLSPERQAVSPQAMSFQKQQGFKAAARLALIGSPPSALMNGVVTRNAEGKVLVRSSLLTC